MKNRTPKLRTGSQLAKALGIDPGTLSRQLKRDDWPVGKSGPWTTADVARIEEWRKTLQEDRSAVGSAHLTKARTALTSVNARKGMIELERKQRELDREKGEYHRVDECRRNRMQGIIVVRTHFMSLKHRAGQLVGLPEDQIRRHLEAWIEDVLRGLAGVPSDPAT